METNKLLLVAGIVLSSLQITGHISWPWWIIGIVFVLPVAYAIVICILIILGMLQAMNELDKL